MLKVSNLSKTYHAPSGDVHALKDFSYAFEAGKVTAIVGPSGSGKSTLLNLLAGLDESSTGSIKLNNTDLTHLPEARRAELRLAKFGFVFQSFNLLSILTALQNVTFPMGLQGLSKLEREAKGKELLGRFGLEDRVHHFPYKLSGGERQRVALARALANDPDVIFADEPTGNLDSSSGDLVLNELFKIAAEGRTVIIVTHDMSIAAKAHALIALKDGSRIDAPMSSEKLPLG